MSGMLGRIFGGGSDRKEETAGRLKLLLLSSVYFLIIAAYTILRDLKNSVFMAVVGKEYIPWAKIIVLLVLVPAILFYSKLVDRIRRYRLLVFYSLFFAAASALLVYFIAHPTIGIGNTDQSPYRLFGWIFYFLVEGFSPFVLSVFWSFVSSVTTPDEGKKNYGLMVGGSKLGGMFSAGMAWILLGSTAFPIIGGVSDIVKHQIVLVAVTFFLLMIPLAIAFLMRRVKGRLLHGYEAAYKVEKKRSKEGSSGTGIFAGLKMFFKYPYVLGIFCMIFFYEMLNAILSYLRLHVAQTTGGSVAGVSAFLFKWVFIMQAVGFVFSVFGTARILKRFNMKISLLMIPAFMAIGSLVFFSTSKAFLIMLAYIMTKTTHYAFSYPVRELLYIPTLKEIKFKSKSWIDAFGGKFAKSTGSSIVIAANKLGGVFFYPILMGVFTVVIGLWFFVAFLLGLRHEKAIKNNEVIGLVDEKPEEDDE